VEYKAFAMLNSFGENAQFIDYTKTFAFPTLDFHRFVLPKVGPISKGYKLAADLFLPGLMPRADAIRKIVVVDTGRRKNKKVLYDSRIHRNKYPDIIVSNLVEQDIIVTVRCANPFIKLVFRQLSHTCRRDLMARMPSTFSDCCYVIKELDANVLYITGRCLASGIYVGKVIEAKQEIISDGNFINLPQQLLVLSVIQTALKSLLIYARGHYGMNDRIDNRFVGRRSIDSSFSH